MRAISVRRLGRTLALIVGGAAALAAAGSGVLRQNGGDIASQANGAATAAAGSPGATGPPLAVPPANGLASGQLPLPVHGQRVRRDTLVIWVEASGRAAPRRAATIYAELEGAVLQVPVAEGSQVHAGGLLLRIDPTLPELEVRRSRAQLESALAEYRGLTLFDDAIEDEKVRRERERHARHRSGLSAAEVALEEAEYRLARAEVRAPFPGLVAGLAVAPGSILRRGDSIASVIDLSPIEVGAHVLETRLRLVEVGRAATITFPALPDETFAGRVVSINPVVASESGTARVTVRLTNSGSRVLPGMHAEVRIAGKLWADRTLVPKVAVVRRGQRDVVFTFEPDAPGSATGGARWRYVTVGLENDRWVELLPAAEADRIEPGDVVLVAGHTTLVHGARVRVENSDQLLESDPQQAGAGGGRAEAGVADG